MSTFRTILVSLVAMAVAMLPLAGGFAHANGAPGMSVTNGPVDCCPEGQPCEKTLHDCGSLAGCQLKCSGLSSAIVAPFTMALTVSATSSYLLHLRPARSLPEPASTASSRLIPN